MSVQPDADQKKGRKMHSSSRSRIYSLTGTCEAGMAEHIGSQIEARAARASFDPFASFPAAQPDMWQAYAGERIAAGLADGESIFLYDEVGSAPALVKARISAWDEEHFGFSLATVSIEFCEAEALRTAEAERLMRRLVAVLQELGVRFATLRVHGDNLAAIHAAQECGFLYYETTISPVLRCAGPVPELDADVRLMQSGDLDRVVSIAEAHHDQRSHFHLDSRFDKSVVKAMYGKWIRTAWENANPVAVIESDGTVAGYFALTENEALSRALDHRYFGMRYLAVDTNLRGAQFGSRLFGGAVRLMREMGAEYVESGYAGRNHVSAHLHDVNGFQSVREDVTLHRWLEV